MSESKSGRLAGRVAIVTGAAQGIGAEYARALAAEGARVSLCDLQAPDAVVDEIGGRGGQAMGRVTDVTDPGAVATLVRETEAAFGRVDVMVTNAALFGTLDLKPFDEISSDEWDAVMRVNTRGVFECVKAVVPVMRRQKYGKIVNIASGTLFKGTTHLLHYVASKGAVVAMTRVMARELGDDGIRVNCVAPGLTVSPNVRKVYKQEWIDANLRSRCIKREEEPSDVVGAVVFLSSAESDFITGQTIVVDGGSVMH